MLTKFILILSKKFSPSQVIGVVRIGIAHLVTLVLIQAALWWTVLERAIEENIPGMDLGDINLQSPTVVANFTLLVSWLYYAIARWIESRFPALRPLGMSGSSAPAYNAPDLGPGSVV
jgi:hypothetical protein